ncbi:MAG: hypothetical protein KDB21_17610 [Acidimicrobiales bacterium]|nr:hypothetical protein [Acidimicrobiales bacterium]
MLGDGVELPAGYVELQLRFARRSAALGTHDFADAMTQLTNLHRRFGFGDPAKPTDERWTRYLDGLDAHRDLGGQVRWTVAFAASNRAVPPPSSAVARAGPFSVHVHGDVLRTHFLPKAADATSPLHASRLPLRRSELRVALEAAYRLCPGAQRVRGASWLYATKSYCALFSRTHIASATERTGVHRFQGSSAWGQFLDHRGGVKANLAARFVAAVDDYDGQAPWTLFPIPTLIVDSPIEFFALGADVGAANDADSETCT